MYVTLIGIQGPGKDQRIVMHPQQSVTVGRTEMSDIVLAADAQVSSRHFLVENDGALAVLKDLKSTNGTKLNGQFVQQATLQDGDTIGVGQTTFQVRIQMASSTAAAGDPAAGHGGAPASPHPATTSGPAAMSPVATPFGSPIDDPVSRSLPAASPTPSSGASQGSPASPIVIPPDQSFYFGSSGKAQQSATPIAADPANGSANPSPTASPIVSSGPVKPSDERKIVVDPRRGAATASASSRHYQRAELENGVLHYQVSGESGSAPESAAPSDAFRPSALLDVWRRFGIPVLMTHFQKAGQPVPEGLGESLPVFDWLPPDLGRQYGPVIWQPEQVADAASLMDPLWGKDALLVVLAGDPAAAAQHLVQLVHHRPFGQSGESSMFGYCWPGVLEKLLQVGDSALGHAIFGDSIVAIAMEVPGHPAAWQLFSISELRGVFDQLGLSGG